MDINGLDLGERIRGEASGRQEVLSERWSALADGALMNKDKVKYYKSELH
jgi:hypothetical protein